MIWVWQTKNLSVFLARKMRRRNFARNRGVPAGTTAIIHGLTTFVVIVANRLVASILASEIWIRAIEI